MTRSPPTAQAACKRGVLPQSGDRTPESDEPSEARVAQERRCPKGQGGDVQGQSPFTELQRPSRALRPSSPPGLGLLTVGLTGT